MEIVWSRSTPPLWSTSVSARWRAPYAVILRHFGKIIFTTAVPIFMPFFCVCFTVLCWKAERVQKHATSYWDARTPARNWCLSQSQLGKIWEEWMKEWMTHCAYWSTNTLIPIPWYQSPETLILIPYPDNNTLITCCWYRCPDADTNTLIPIPKAGCPKTNTLLNNHHYTNTLIYY